MRRRTFLTSLLVTGSAGLLTSVEQEGAWGAPFTPAGEVEGVATTDALRRRCSAAGACCLQGYFNPFDGGGGVYRADRADCATADETFDGEGRWTLVDAAGTRWKRSFPSEIAPIQIGVAFDGTDQSARLKTAFNAAAAAKKKIVFTGTGTIVLKSPVSVAGSGLDIDFGAVTFACDFPGHGCAFVFGTRSDIPTHSGLRISGGTFTPADPQTRYNVMFLLLRGIKDFTVKGCHLKNVGNGGLLVEAGCENGTIEDVTILGRSNYRGCRGIWLNGATASDFVDQVVDIKSISRNARSLPRHGIKDITISRCQIKLPAYGIYLMNTRNCEIFDSIIDISGGGERCIAFNNYSPSGRAIGNTLISDHSSTGILVTQASDNVVIEKNKFQGTFGGGRDVYVAYLGRALITDNQFTTESSQNIQIDMGGSATIRNNTVRCTTYKVGRRFVELDTIDGQANPASMIGDTATSLPGSTIENNTLYNRTVVTRVMQRASARGNVPGLGKTVVRNNTIHQSDIAIGADKNTCQVYGPRGPYPVAIVCEGNKRL